MVSIIIPAFNSEKYIEKCIASIINQTYQNWELIIVDDGSDDSTVDIVQSFANDDGRIRCLSQQNSGVSSARNLGMSYAKGEYIVFVDSDDYLPVDSIEMRVNQLGSADLLVGAFQVIDENDSVIKGISCINQKWNSKEFLENTIVEGKIGYQGYLWNKIFKKSVIDDFHLKFDDSIYYNEDRLFCVRYGEKCNSIILTEDVIYYYRKNNSSVMNRIPMMNDNEAKRVLTEFCAYEELFMISHNIGRSMEYKCAVNAMEDAKRLLGLLPQECIATRKKTVKYYRKFAIRAFLTSNNDIQEMASRVKLFVHFLLGR